jgi:hypothetical protein
MKNARSTITLNPLIAVGRISASNESSSPNSFTTR